MQHQRHILAALVIVGSCFAAGSSFADCSNLPKWHQLRTALQKARSAEKSGLENQMWGTIVDIDGTVCAVAFSGGVFTDQWLGSRVISATKANTAKATTRWSASASVASTSSVVGSACTRTMSRLGVWA